MNLYAANSFSADTVSNILSFLFIALILKHTFCDKKITYKSLLILVCIVSLLALAKVVYIGLVLLFLIIPFTKFKNKRQFFLFAGILFLATFIVATYWSIQITSKYTPYVNYNPNHRDWICLTTYSNYDEQKSYIFSHGLYFAKVIFRTIFYYPYNYLGGYIGTYGNGDIPTPVWLLYTSYALLIFIALFEKNNFKFNAKQKLIIFCGAFSAFLLLLLSQHLTWDAVGADYVDNVQGRYLIPIFPCIFILIGNYSIKININYCAIIISLVAVLYAVGAYRVVNRYYVGSCKEKQSLPAI